MTTTASRPDPVRHQAAQPRPDRAGRSAADSCAPAGSVVVALDASATSSATLAWAARYARRVHAELRAVHVLADDPAGGAPLTETWSHPAAVFTRSGQLRHLFEDALPEPFWTLRFLRGDAGQEVVAYARQARLLVIGAPAPGETGRPRPDSVGHYCLARADAPTVAVPDSADRHAAAQLRAGTPDLARAAHA